MNHFRKEFKCTRNKNGKCPFYKTCYGIHNDALYKNSEDEAEESEESIDEENYKKKMMKLIK